MALLTCENTVTAFYFIVSLLYFTTANFRLVTISLTCLIFNDSTAKYAQKASSCLLKAVRVTVFCTCPRNSQRRATCVVLSLQLDPVTCLIIVSSACTARLLTINNYNNRRLVASLASPPAICDVRVSRALRRSVRPRAEWSAVRKSTSESRAECEHVFRHLPPLVCGLVFL